MKTLCLLAMLFAVLPVSPVFAQTTGPKKGTLVVMGGGRQWRLADTYLHTRVLTELKALLERGGVIGGTSAGASIQSDFMVRGDTNGNEKMEGDHLVGFGFLQNAAIDQHILRRNRQFDLIPVIEKHPKLLGIGIDEDTAIVVQGDQFEVIGASYVAITDAQQWKSQEATSPNGAATKGKFYLLSRGERFDLKTRRVIPSAERGSAPFSSVSTVAQADRSAPPDDAELLYKAVPQGDWTYAAVDRLLHRNVIRFYPYVYFSGKPVRTRFDFSVAVSRSAYAIAAEATRQQNQDKPVISIPVDGIVEMQAPPAPPPPAEDLKLLRKLCLEFKAGIVRLGYDWKNMDACLQKLQDKGLHQYLADALVAGPPKTEDAAPGLGSKVVKRPDWAYDALKQLRHSKEASQIPEDRLLTRDEFAGIIDRGVAVFLKTDRTPDSGAGPEPVSTPPPYGLSEVIALHKLTHAFRFEIAPTGRDIKRVENLFEQAEEKRIAEEEIIDTKPPVPATNP